MRLMRFPYTIAGQWVSGLTAVAFMIATTGCSNSQFPQITPAGDNPFGVLVNTDTSKDLIGGVRLQSGEAVYVYGTFNQDGSIKQITAAVVENADGQQASLTFESGRPKKGVLFDGSTLEITYTQVSNERLSGQIVLVPAGTGATRTIPFDIDLLKAAADLAQLVEDLTGIQIPANGSPAGATARTAMTGDGPVPITKQTHRTELPILLVALVPIAFATTGFLLTSVMAQIMEAFVQTADAVAQAIAMAILTPFIVMGALMQEATSQPILTIDIEIHGPRLHIPSRPQI